MIPELIDTERAALEGDVYACELVERWLIDPRTARALTKGARALEFGVSIISGNRSCEEQEELLEEGRTRATCLTSTHVSCPATGVDVWPSVAPVGAVKARLGAEMVLSGLRWGGGSTIDPSTGIPRDWNHFDLGPRTPPTAN